MAPGTRRVDAAEEGDGEVIELEDGAVGHMLEDAEVVDRDAVSARFAVLLVQPVMVLVVSADDDHRPRQSSPEPAKSCG